jgi:hypothetical protein
MSHKIVVHKLWESGSKAGEPDVDIVIASPHFSPETISQSGKYRV